MGLKSIDPENRREAVRYPIEKPVVYKLITWGAAVNEVGVGRTINISSNGVLFTTHKFYPAGTRLEIFINWPRSANGQTLKVTARGPVVRSKQTGDSTWETAIEIPQYE